MTEDYFKALGIDILSATSVFALDKWEIPRDRVVINRKLGEGAFGTVYGELKGDKALLWLSQNLKVLILFPSPISAGGECFFDDKGWVSSNCELRL